MKICFTCNWGQNEAELLERFRKQTPGNSGRWYYLEGVSEIEDADWVVVLGAVREEVKAKLDPAKTFYILREPTKPEMANEVEAAIKLTYADSYCAGIWWVEQPFDLLLQSPPPAKTANLTCVITAKQSLPGHKLRYAFLKMFTERYPGMVDVWGIDSQQMAEDFDLDYKGPVPYNGANGCHGDKWRALAPYRYALCMENVATSRYFSEKLLDAFLAGCVPVYWGATDILEFFPRGSLKHLQLHETNLDTQVDRLLEMVRKPPDSLTLAAVAEARRRVLLRYNLWALVQQVLETGHVFW